jgi:hypothetical protein
VADGADNLSVRHGLDGIDGDVCLTGAVIVYLKNQLHCQHLGQRHIETLRGVAVNG